MGFTAFPPSPDPNPGRIPCPGPIGRLPRSAVNSPRRIPLVCSRTASLRPLPSCGYYLFRPATPRDPKNALRTTHPAQQPKPSRVHTDRPKPICARVHRYGHSASTATEAAVDSLQAAKKLRPKPQPFGRRRSRCDIPPRRPKATPHPARCDSSGTLPFSQISICYLQAPKHRSLALQTEVSSVSARPLWPPKRPPRLFPSLPSKWPLGSESTDKVEINCPNNDYASGSRHRNAASRRTSRCRNTAQDTLPKQSATRAEAWAILIHRVET